LIGGGGVVAKGGGCRRGRAWGGRRIEPAGVGVGTK